MKENQCPVRPSLSLLPVFQTMGSQQQQFTAPRFAGLPLNSFQNGFLFFHSLLLQRLARFVSRLTWVAAPYYSAGGGETNQFHCAERLEGETNEAQRCSNLNLHPSSYFETISFETCSNKNLNKLQLLIESNLRSAIQKLKTELQFSHDKVNDFLMILKENTTRLGRPYSESEAAQ